MSLNKSNILLISVDALAPFYVFSDLELPNIKNYFIKNGTYAKKGVKSVFPTFTYPCHQSLITGANPINHGIHNNIIFDPNNDNKEAWNWFVSDKVKNLWSEAKNNGYLSVSTAFPTSVGAKGDYIIPEFWWNGTELDEMFIDNLSTPKGIVFEMKKDIGQYPNGLDLTLLGDKQRFKSAMWLLDNKLKNKEKPFFMTTYFASFDETMHIHGVNSYEAKKCLIEIDTMIGMLIEKVIKDFKQDFVIVLVSDHGSIDNHTNICPNTVFYKNKLITIDEQENLLDWQVFSQRAGGCSEVRLKDKNDKEVKQKVKVILDELQKDKNSGVLEILDNNNCRKRGSFPEADFVIVSKEGFEIRDNYTGPYIRENITQKAQHGYSENFEKMNASFLVHGKGIGKDKDIGKINLIDIAPTLSEIMGFNLDTADGVSFYKKIMEV